jgi:hypothetical protein
MKTKLLAFTAALLLSGLATGICYAQQPVLAVNIPFAFQAGDQILPAGEYRLEPATSGAGQFERLRQVDGDAVLIVSTIPVQSKTENPDPALIFHRYGQTYFLAQIWTGGATGRQLLKSDREKEMARGEESSELALLLHPTFAGPQLTRHAA